MVSRQPSSAEASSPEVCLVNKDLPRSQIAKAIATTLFDVFADDKDENYPKALADVLINGIILKLENGRKFTTLEEEFLRSDTVKNHSINYKLIKHLRIHGSVDDNPYIREEGGSYFIDTQAILDAQPNSIESSLNDKSENIEEERESRIHTFIKNTKLSEFMDSLIHKSDVQTQKTLNRMTSNDISHSDMLSPLMEILSRKTIAHVGLVSMQLFYTGLRDHLKSLLTDNADESDTLLIKRLEEIVDMVNKTKTKPGRTKLVIDLSAYRK